MKKKIVNYDILREHYIQNKRLWRIVDANNTLSTIIETSFDNHTLFIYLFTLFLSTLYANMYFY